MAKEQLEKAYALVEKLTTAEQVTLKSFIEKTLQDKANAAADELDIINGTKS